MTAPDAGQHRGEPGTLRGWGLPLGVLLLALALLGALCAVGAGFLAACLGLVHVTLTGTGAG